MPTDDSRLRLLPPAALLHTGEVDHADWNYRPGVGTIQRLRFKLIRSLLGNQCYSHLLEIGYGSGVFMPELARRCDHLYGADPHPHPEKVAAILAEHGVEATLASAGADALPYPDGLFDCLVVVSALEFIPDLDAACREMLRVMTPDGILVIVTPGVSPMLDLGLKILTGASPKDDFGDRRKRILPCLLSHFQVERRMDYPPVIHRATRLYTAMRLCRMAK